MNKCVGVQVQKKCQLQMLGTKNVTKNDTKFGDSLVGEVESMVGD